MNIDKLRLFMKMTQKIQQTNVNQYEEPSDTESSIDEKDDINMIFNKLELTNEDTNFYLEGIINNYTVKFIVDNNSPDSVIPINIIEACEIKSNPVMIKIFDQNINLHYIVDRKKYSERLYPSLGINIINQLK
jgi:hypothetical protein